MEEGEGVLDLGEAGPLAVGGGAVQSGQGAGPHGGGQALGDLGGLGGQGDGGHGGPALGPEGGGGEGGAIGAHRRPAVAAGDELGKDHAHPGAAGEVGGLGRGAEQEDIRV